VVFDVGEDALVERLLTRGRADDTEDTIRNRFKVYQELTAPLLELYGERGLIVEIDGNGDVDEVTDRILTALETYDLPPTSYDRAPQERS
jgi:adenylate kinase